METHRRGSDGRRFFTTQFKQEQIARVVRQELTLSELARELAVSPSVDLPPRVVPHPMLVPAPAHRPPNRVH